MKNYANFKQLKDAVSIATKTGRPTAKQLRESGEEIVARTPAISVYKNGYFTCTVNNHSTVFGVHEIKFLDGGEDSVTKKHIQIFDIDDLPWETVLYMIGTDRIERNADVREGSHRMGSADGDEDEAKLNVIGNPGVRHELRVPHYDFVEEMMEQQEHEQRLKTLAEGMKTLTDNERRTVSLYYENRTEAEVAKILSEEKTDGSKVSQQAVHKTLARALEKLKMFFKESGC